MCLLIRQSLGGGLDSGGGGNGGCSGGGGAGSMVKNVSVVILNRLRRIATPFSHVFSDF